MYYSRSGHCKKGDSCDYEHVDGGYQGSPDQPTRGHDYRPPHRRPGRRPWGDPRPRPPHSGPYSGARPQPTFEDDGQSQWAANYSKPGGDKRPFCRLFLAGECTDLSCKYPKALQEILGSHMNFRRGLKERRRSQ